MSEEVSKYVPEGMSEEVRLLMDLEIERYVYQMDIERGFLLEAVSTPVSLVVKRPDRQD